jgi:hypothetical protein
VTGGFASIQPPSPASDEVRAELLECTLDVLTTEHREPGDDLGDLGAHPRHGQP